MEEKRAFSSRKNLSTIAAIGMCDGMAEMIIENNKGKKVLPKYGREIKALCHKAFELWGKIDLTESSNQWVPRSMSNIDSSWKKHRTSIITFVSMLAPIISDCAVFIARSKKPDSKKMRLLNEFLAYFNKIIFYYEQRGADQIGEIEYGKSLYREWIKDFGNGLYI